jgi:hypothetical protein
MEIIIHDKRPEKDFNSTTFSNYKKSDVVKTFIDAMNNQNVENALFWSTELLCSGRLKDLWDAFIITMGKHIRGGNPKLATYISIRFEKFKEIIINGYADNELEVRNSADMRKLLAEIVLVLCYSPKKPSLQMLKINKKEDFSFDRLGLNLKADNMDWCKKVMKEKDPKEIILCLNEFTYHFYNNNLLRACYWVDWLIDFDALCRKQKKPITILEREFVKVDPKFMSDPIWLLWEVLKGRCRTEEETIINALLDLFSIKYNFTQKKKRKHLLYLGIELFTENPSLKIPIVHQSDKIKAVLPQVCNFYKAIKKYEQRPDIINDKHRNLQKSIDKMKMLFDF